MGLRCFTRKRTNPANIARKGLKYTTCIEINEGQRAIGNNLIPRQEQERGLGNNLLALEAPPPLMLGGNIQQPPPMDNEVASNVRDEIRRNMRDRATDKMNKKEVASNVKDEIRRNMKERALDEMDNEEKREEIRRLERELEM